MRDRWRSRAVWPGGTTGLSTLSPTDILTSWGSDYTNLSGNGRRSTGRRDESQTSPHEAHSASSGLRPRHNRKTSARGASYTVPPRSADKALAVFTFSDQLTASWQRPGSWKHRWQTRPATRLGYAPEA